MDSTPVDKYTPLGDGSYPSRFVEFFGPSMWKTLHSVTFSYPLNPSEQDKENYTTFFKSVGPVVPCPKCAVHYQQYLSVHEPKVESREALTKWLYDLHDLVNRRSGKESPSFDEVKKMYAGWSQADNDAFNGLNRRYKLKRMADPHFDRLPGAGTQSPLEEVSTRNMIGIAVLAVLLLLLAIGGYVWYKRNQAYNRAKGLGPKS